MSGVIQHSQQNNFSIAILVLTYNHADYIEQCLSSILSLDFPGRHIWVLDDGSSDATPEIVRRMSAAHGGITLMTQPNSGGRTSLNAQRLLELSKGKYVMFMSGDDMLGPGYPLRKFFDYLEGNPNVCLALPRVIQLNQSSTRDCPALYDEAFLKILHSGDPEIVVVQHLFKRVSAIFIQGMLVKREALQNARGFDTDLTGDDYVLISRLFFMMKKQSLKFKFFEDAFWLYRVHENNIHKNSLRQVKIIAETVGKYIPRQFWSGFAWHLPALRNAEEISHAESILINNLGEDYATTITGKIIQRTLEHWIGSSQFLNIKNLFVGTTLELVTKLGLAKLLLLALPRGFMLVALRSSALASAIRQLSRAAQSRQK